MPVNSYTTPGVTYNVDLFFTPVTFVDEDDFKMFGLNQDDFKDLKWEDEPVEVFLNMEKL